ncbi:MAG: SRPBCC family protein [Syntrophaceae bacterium]|nr:SRPBCC family protein [Syntrophaceae bacterium]
MFSYSKEAEINAPIERVYQVMVDWKNYRRLFPSELRKIKIISETDTSAKVNYTVKYIMTVNYTIEYKAILNKSLKWKLTEEGSILKKDSGSVELTSLGKNLTKGVLRAKFDFAFFVPTLLVENRLTESFDIMLNNVKKIAEKRK